MIIGASIKRKEDPRLLLGEGRYIDDVRLPGMLHAAIVRSPQAHARIGAIDAAAARGLPGVALVATAEDLGHTSRIPIRLGPRPALEPFLQPVLARWRVRYVGEPVAVVVAGDRRVAEDAAELVTVDYETLPVVPDIEQAIRPDAVALHEGTSGNVADRLLTTVADADAAMAGAPVRLRRRLTVQRHSGVPMETRGLLAAYDAATGLLTMWGPTKVPHFNRRVLAGLLGWPEERIRFVEPDVGGGFGVRGEFYPEDFLIPWAAIRLRRPVKWVEDRREHLAATNHSRQQIHDVEIGATRDGRLVALIDHVAVDMGAYLRTHGVTVPELTGALLPGPYRLPHYRCEVACVMTNKTPTGTYRAPGRYEGNFVRERTMDLLAQAVGLDPAEIRRRNFIPPDAMPYTVGTRALGEVTTYDVGAYASTLEAALEAIRYPQARHNQSRARNVGRRVGVGIGCFVEKAGPGPWEAARVVLDATGRATVYTGGTSLGQGIETVLAQICAQQLGLAVDDVTVRHGDTAEVPDGVGAWGSRVTVVGGCAVHYAAGEVKTIVLERAAKHLEAAARDLVIENGHVWVRGAPGRRVAVKDLVPREGLSAAHRYHATKMTYPYGAHAAVVDVDPSTGQVTVLDYAIAYDVGRAVNPRLVEGQLVGGLAQGLGGALLEELAYDEQGQLLSATLMDYLLPSSMEMPRRVTIRILEETPTPLNPLGVKGAGEGGTAAVGAAIANAIADALGPQGTAIADLPVTPQRVVEALARR
jgi:carbon-monoxide dehydrogenase large subunit